jgi:hypothetical protein
MLRRVMGERARRFIVNRFSLPKMVASYERLYAELLAEKAKRFMPAPAVGWKGA